MQRPPGNARHNPHVFALQRMLWWTQGLGVSNLFHFFLLQSDGVKRASVERKPRESKEKPEDTPGPEEVSIAKTTLSEQGTVSNLGDYEPQAGSWTISILWHYLSFLFLRPSASTRLTGTTAEARARHGRRAEGNTVLQDPGRSF